MTTNNNYQLKLEALKAIDETKVTPPDRMPVEVYVQEAENLSRWCAADKEDLTAKGLSWETVEDLPVRCGALREAESLWTSQRFTREEAARKWAEESPRAYELRDDLLHDFRFAFRRDAELSAKVAAIAEGHSHADMIQDLNDLGILGRENPGLLAKINFDMSLLDRAAETAAVMAEVLATASGERLDTSEALKMRDRAFTHLKEAVDEIREYGRYVFRRNEERLRGYRSQYLRRKRIARQEKKAAAGQEGPTAKAEEQQES